MGIVLRNSTTTITISHVIPPIDGHFMTKTSTKGSTDSGCQNVAKSSIADWVGNPRADAICTHRVKGRRGGTYEE